MSALDFVDVENYEPAPFVGGLPAWRSRLDALQLLADAFPDVENRILAAECMLCGATSGDRCVSRAGVPQPRFHDVRLVPLARRRR